MWHYIALKQRFHAYVSMKNLASVSGINASWSRWSTRCSVSTLFFLFFFSRCRFSLFCGICMSVFVPSSFGCCQLGTFFPLEGNTGGSSFVSSRDLRPLLVDCSTQQRQVQATKKTKKEAKAGLRQTQTSIKQPSARKKRQQKNKTALRQTQENSKTTRRHKKKQRKPGQTQDRPKTSLKQFSATNKSQKRNRDRPKTDPRQA